MKYQGIILSGLPGAGKSALAQRLAKFYGWTVISVGDLWRKRWQESSNGKLMAFEEFWHGVSDADNLEMDRQIERVFAKGAIIGDCRFVKNLQKYPLLLVFVAADLNTRAGYKKGSQKYGGKTIDQIKKIIERRLRDELEVARRLYGYDYRDQAIYHLVLNSAMMSLDEEIASIVSIVANQ